MSKKAGIIVSILSIIALCVSLYAAAQVRGAAGETTTVEETTVVEESAKDVQYVMYVGTNGQDSNEAVFTPDEAKKAAEEILLRHFGGYTIQEANGGWVDDGKVYTEYTLVIYLSDTDIESVHAAADEMLKTFDQSSVLIQENQTTTEFYDGNNQ